MIVEPAGVHSPDDAPLPELARFLRGRVVVAASVTIPYGAAYSAPCGERVASEVDLGVVLGLSDGQALEVQWATPGLAEGMRIALHDQGALKSTNLLDYVDVSDESCWARLVGQSIGTVGVGFRLIDDMQGSIVPRPWSLRIETGGRRPHTVVFALGELSDGVPEYSPDNLVVFFDETEARRMIDDECLTSAWGVTLA